MARKTLSRNGSSFAAMQGTHDFGAQLKQGKEIRLQEEAERKDLKSVMEMESVDEFLVHAKMTRREFEAQRGRIESHQAAVVVPASAGARLVGSAGEGGGGDAEGATMIKPYEWHALPMPERPAWKYGDGVGDLDAKEAEAFLDWRRRLAATEEAVMVAQEARGAAAGASVYDQARVTPYEKNIEVWRQLWRVVERSDVLLQVVDSRNPLFYYSQVKGAHGCAWWPLAGLRGTVSNLAGLSV